MTRKTAEAKIFKMKPAEFIADFEGGVRKAVNTFYPDAVLHGCWYHYKVAIRMKFMKLSLFDLITHDSNANILYGMVQNLPLLPPEKILEGYAIIKNRAH